MTGIFISHSSKDSVIAHALAAELKARGYVCFLDFQSIPGGAQWEQEIYAAMRQSVAVVLCATPEAMESRWVFAEIVMARYSGITLIPLIMRECTLPANVEATTQYIDFTRDPGAGYAKLWEALSRLDLTPSGPQWPRDKSPYPGLAAMQEEHAPVFFGRERELADAIAALRPGAQQRRFLAIIGPSGSGKSSLARAGIIPALKRGVLPGSEKWLYVPPFTPSQTPFRNLAEKLRAADRSLGRVRAIEQRLREPDGLLYTLLDLRDGGAQVVLLIDQLEEIERRTPRSEATPFLARLRETLDAPDTPLMVLATLRADFVSACLQFPDLADLLQSGTQLLGVMNRAALRQTILGPARVAGLTFEEGLVEEILDDTAGGDALPLMAHVLEQLWQGMRASGERTITRAAYLDTGRVEGALARRAQELYDATPEAEHEALRVALVELADVNEHGDFTRRRVPSAALPTSARSALERFVTARLLMTSAGESGPQIEVAHEALLRNWPLLRGWLEAESERLRLRRDIELNAADWEAHNRSDAYLWQDERLENALRLMAREAWPQDDRRRVFLEMARQRDEAARERESMQLAGRVLSDYQKDPERGILLCLAAIEQYAWTPLAEFALNTCLSASRMRGYFRHEGRVTSAAFSPDGRRVVAASDDKTARVWDTTTGKQLLRLSGHKGRVTNAAFSPDGTRMVTASSDDKTARVWDAISGKELLRLSIHHSWVASVAISLDGTRVVAASYNGEVFVWEVTNRREPLRLIIPERWVSSVAISPDGTRVVIALPGATVQVWDAINGKELLRLSGHEGGVTSAAFSPDGRRVVTASDDKTARVWDAASGQELLCISGHKEPVTNAAFSPDGRRVVTTSYDKTARVWNAASGQELLCISGHKGPVTSAAFSTDGTRVVITSLDDAVRVWDATNRQELLRLSGHRDRLISAAFNPDGRWVVTASTDKTARVWDADRGQERLLLSGHTDRLTSAAFSPDGTRVMTASYDGTVRVWDVTSCQELLRISGYDRPVTSAVYSPDGKRVVTTSNDSKARVWDAPSGQELLRLSGHRDRLASAAFSPDGARLVTASNDKTVRIWNIASGQELLCLSGHEGPVTSVAFSPDGARVVTGSRDGTARVWDATNGQELLRLSGHKRPVNSAAFSSDGTRIVTASHDNTARVWDATSGQELLRLSGHVGLVTSAAFSPDGTWVVTASADKTARIWRALTREALVAFARTRVFRELTPEERREYGLGRV